ncbi:MAG: hypothetical protein ACJ70S_08680 [Nitrososphaera sp.]
MSDWIRLLVKYKGKCSACGKEISAGQYALWSKSGKTIKHNECNAPQTATTEKRHVNTNMQQGGIAVVDCFICGRPISDIESRFEEPDHYDRQGISQASICNMCLEDRNAYQNYQLSFLKRVHRLAKIKLGQPVK